MNNDNLFGGMPKDNVDNNSGTQMPNNNFTEPNSGFVNRTVLPNQGINNTINNNTFSVNQQANNANMPYGNQQNFNGNMPYGNQQNYNVNQNINMPNGNNYVAGNTYNNSPYNNQPMGNPYGNAQQNSQPVENPYGNQQQYNQPANGSYSANQYNNQMNYNQYTPNVQYMPLTPDTVLPPDVQPVYMNGAWYYPVSNAQWQKPEKRKMPLSIKVLLAVIISLTIGFVVALCGWVGHLQDNGEKGAFSEFFYQVPTESATTKKYDEDTAYIYANPNGPKIELKDNKTKDGSTEKAYDKLSDSVVSISVFSDDDDTPDNSSPIGEGTGIIISEDGYIVTNSHVVSDDLESNVWITKKSGKVYSAVVVGVDARTDLAVLWCKDAEDWKYAEFADSEQLKVGQEVVAIGSPGGSEYSSSITRGVISALNRLLSGTAGEYIQTDTAINPGNSGGPLANLNGQVIGINTIKFVDTEYEGMGFAIPSKKIKEIADQLIANGYVKGRVRLGIMAEELSSAYANMYKIDRGILIRSIDENGPLKDTKIKERDVITEIDGKSVETFNKLYDVLDEHESGDTVTLTICRFDKKKPGESETFTVEITLMGDQE